MDKYPTGDKGRTLVDTIQGEYSIHTKEILWPFGKNVRKDYVET